MMHHIESLLESKINSVEQIGKSIVTYNSDHDKLSHRSGENRIHKAALERIEMHVEEDCYLCAKRCKDRNMFKN